MRGLPACGQHLRNHLPGGREDHHALAAADRALLLPQDPVRSPEVPRRLCHHVVLHPLRPLPGKLCSFKLIPELFVSERALAFKDCPDRTRTGRGCCTLRRAAVSALPGSSWGAVVSGPASEEESSCFVPPRCLQMHVLLEKASSKGTPSEIPPRTSRVVLLEEPPFSEHACSDGPEHG